MPLQPTQHPPYQATTLNGRQDPSMTENTPGAPRSGHIGRGPETLRNAGRARAEYQTVNLGGRRLRWPRPSPSAPTAAAATATTAPETAAPTVPERAAPPTPPAAPAPPGPPEPRARPVAAPPHRQAQQGQASAPSRAAGAARVPQAGAVAPPRRNVAAQDLRHHNHCCQPPRHECGPGRTSGRDRRQPRRVLVALRALRRQRVLPVRRRRRHRPRRPPRRRDPPRHAVPHRPAIAAPPQSQATNTARGGQRT